MKAHVAFLSGRWFGPIRSASLLSGVLFSCAALSAHTLPCFMWFDTARQATVSPEEVRVTHLCRWDLLTFRPEDPLVDTDGDTSASEHEMADCCALTARYLAQDFLAVSDGRPLAGSLESFQVLEGNQGFRTETVFPLPPAGAQLQIALFDPAYLAPRLQGPEPDPLSGTIRSTTESVALLSAEGDWVTSVPLPRQFSTQFIVQRKNAPTAEPVDSGGLLDQFEILESTGTVTRPANPAGQESKP